VTRARLFLSGIRAEGRHGARAGEKDELQPFVVDLDIEVDAGDDSIEATADYRGITDAVREVVEQGSFDLIETMAEVIARRIASMAHVAEATAVVHKPNAAGRLGIDGVAAAATATGGATGSATGSSTGGG
jgi:dihydroneopterin aldolase